MLTTLNGIWLTEGLVNDLALLFKELSPTKNVVLTIDTVRALTVKPNSYFVVSLVDCEDRSAIVGMGSIHYYDTLDKRKAVIENVVVREDWRGRKIGKQILDELLRIARNLNVKEINLSSNISRKRSHALYRSLGFTRPPSLLFRMKLISDKV